LRADAVRNRALLVTVASEVVAEQGAEASLEEIARRAGVGSATLHRHFPTRLSLLDAVFTERVDALCALAEELASTADPVAALTQWLAAVVHHAVRNRGLATSLLADTGASSHAKVLAAGEKLVTQSATSIRPEATTADLLKLANGIALAAGNDETTATRLLTLALTGVTR
jgi:AcrR family transcriptional regulator